MFVTRSNIRFIIKHHQSTGVNKMTDQTLVVVKMPEELEAAQAKAYADLASWCEKAALLKVLRTEEMELRNKTVQYFFPSGLKEGVNDCEMPEGWKLKVTGKINRKIDAATISAVTLELEALGVDAAEFIKYKPELSIPDYRGLIEAVNSTSGKSQEKNKKILATFDQMLIITDGSPEVELIQPKKPKAKVKAL